jgi:hypothetical protein
MPMLYGLADRRPATFSYMHWLDVCPDHVAERDAARLVKSPPALMVVMTIPTEHLAVLEWSFRPAGQGAGQRVVEQAIEALLPRYDLVGEFVSPGIAAPIRVWALRRATDRMPMDEKPS